MDELDHMEKKSMSFCQVPINHRMGSHSECQPERYINMHNNTQVMNHYHPSISMFINIYIPVLQIKFVPTLLNSYVKKL